MRDVIAKRNQAVQGRDAVTDANEHFAAERTGHFVGRAEALATIAHELNEPIGHPLVVTGASGAGKSTLLAEAARRAAAARPDAVIASRYIGITPGTSSLRDLLVGLRREIMVRYGQETPAAPAEDAQLIAEFPAALACATGERPLILVVDALDQLGTAPQRVDWLPIDLPLHVHVIVSVLPDRSEFDRLRERLDAEQIVRLDALTPTEGAELLGRWLLAAGRALQPNQRDAMLATFAEEGLPLYLRLAFEQARRWRSFEAVPALPATIPDMLRNLFNGFARDDQHGPMLVAHALGDLGAAKNGLAEDEVLDVLGQDGIVSEDLLRLSPDSPRVEVDRRLPLPAVLWARLYADLEPYLTERDADGTELITFYHRQLHEAVEEAYLLDEDGLLRHRTLARYYEWQPLLVGAQPNLRKLTEQPFQEAAGDLASEFTQTYTDIALLEQKIAYQGTVGALEDLALRPGDWILDQVAAALRAGAHILDHAPEQLESQLRGRMPVAVLVQFHDFPERPLLRLLSPTLAPTGGNLVRVLTGHSDAVYGCAFSPDSQLALSASHDHTLRLWEVATGRTVRIFTGHVEGVNSCAFDPNGRLALSASSDATLRLWDVASGETIRVLTGAPPGSASWEAGVTSCAFSPNGRLALGAAADRTIRLWDVESGRTLRVLGGNNTCAFSPDGRLALSAAPDLKLRLWEVATGRTIHVLAGHSDEIDDCAFSPDGRLALSASHDGTLRVWDLGTGQTIRTLAGHIDVVHGCAFSPDGRLALSASWDGTLRLWDLSSGQVTQTLAEHTGSVEHCAFSPDGRLVLSASLDRTLRLWEVASAQTVPSLRHSSAVYDCTFSPDGRLAFSASAPLNRLLTDPDAFSRPRDVLLLWNAVSRQPVRPFEGHTSVVTCCAFSPDGYLALSGSWDKTLRLWDVESSQPMQVFKGHTTWVTHCAFSPDGRLALSASSDHTLRLWEVATGEAIRVLEGHTGEFSCCAFSLDGRLVLSASSDLTFRFWDVESGQAVRVLTGHVVRAFSPDRRLMLTTSSGETLQLCDVESGRTVRVLEGNADTVYRCSFSLDGLMVLGTSHDHTLRLWEVESGREITRWIADRELWCCAFSPNGTRAMAGDQGGNVHFLEIAGVEAMKLATSTDAATSTSDGAASDDPAPGDVPTNTLRGATRPKHSMFNWWRRR